ncbi:MAG: HAMP domain-containing sensor histidine kinase [Myxococcota bacterium]
MVTEDEPVTPPAEPEDLNLRILQPMFRYIRTNHGDDVLHRIVQEAGLDPSILRRSSPWISLATFEAILSGCRELVGSDKAFIKACVHDLKKVYGPMMLVIRSMTVVAGYRAMARTGHLVSKVSHYEVVESGRDSILLRYHSKHPDSHLNCLSRQAQIGHIPSLWWGIPPAKVQVNKRLCDGDAYCEYYLRWREPVKLRYPILGGLLGFLLGKGLASVGVDGLPLLAPLLSVVGVATGLFLQMRRMLLDYVAVAEETSYEVEQVVQAHARAVDELLALHQREREWSNTLETRFHERREQLEQVVEAIDGGDELRDDKLLNLSHDMNNPLTVLLASAQHLESAARLGSDERDSIDAISGSARRIQTLLSQMSGIMRGDQERVAPTEQIDVDDLANKIRRQLRATVMSRDIRVTVFQTREAPQLIQTDGTILERVVDNLLTNACKYTKRGSIVVEVAGTPGNLLLKISDTGRGIGEDRLEQVFISGQPDRSPLIGTSHGDGLGIVVRLLDQLSGRLEIMSTPGEGTTLWVSIPVQPPTSSGSDCRASADTPRTRFERVVKIRPRA